MVKNVCDDLENPNVIALGMFKLNTFSSVRRPKPSGVMWKKKGSSNTVKADLSSVHHSNLNKNVKRYSRNNLMAYNNSNTCSEFACNNARNTFCNSYDVDVNDLFIFDDIVQICLWIIDSVCSKHMKSNRALLMNSVEKFLGMVRFGNNDFTVIAGYGDVIIRSMTIKKVYYVEGLGDIGVFVGYSIDSAAFKVYNKRTRKIHKSVNVNFDKISEMASKQFSLEPSLTNLNEKGKYSNPTVSQVFELSKKDLEDLFHNSYDEYFNASKESSSSSLNDDVQQSPEEVILPQTNTQSILNDMIPNVVDQSSSHNVFNERLEDAYFDASTAFHDTSDVHTYYQPYLHKTKWTKDHPLHKIIGDLKSSVRTRGQLENSCLFPCLLSIIKPANMAEALKDFD
uniref:Integrase, catalytic region, zinc finger, CCHC-type, peptidase aspartic, catalytic n=1 Tax=Tanacetum cinerariifolium TaxID=118510 RepID=A0A699JYC4_TANCI|nr:hypothetical protein [Tanacetum cinerariifolium]